MKKVLLTTGIAVLALATLVSAAYDVNLTVGSTGADVVALQTALISAGYDIPAISSGAAAPGYFGSQTKAAVKLYQAANGVPNTGFVGPLTRGVLNGGTTVVAGCPAGLVCTPIAPVAVACPVGYVCTAIPGTTVVPVVTTGITTPGAEGIITTKLATTPIADPNVRIATNVPAYGIEVKAQGSDMIVDRVLLQMSVGVGSATASLSNPFTFVKALYAYDGDTLLKQWNLTASDFNKDSSDRYYVIASGLRFVVPKNATKVLTFKIDTVGVSADQSSRYVDIQGYAGNTQNVRAVDGAGLNSYTDMSTSANTREQIFTTSGSSALTVTLNSALTPKAQTNYLSTSNGASKVTLQVVDVKSETGDSTITNVDVYVHATSTVAALSTKGPNILYLYDYDGLTLLQSQSVNADGNDAVNFTNLTWVVPKDTIKKLIIKADFPTTAGGQAASTSIPANGIKWTKPDSTTASTSPTGALTSNDQYFYSAAPKWELVSANSTVAAGVKDISSSTITATIVLKATAQGGSMTKPIASDFGFVFASSTQSGGAYTSGNSIGVLPTVAVTPTDATVGDGGTYQVTLVGLLPSGTSTTVFYPALGTSYSEYAAINSVSSSVGGNAISNQTWGLNTFYAPAVALSRGSF